MLVTAPFPFQMEEEDSRKGTCVFKLMFGSKYFIYKGLKVKKTVENLSVQIHKELNNPKENSILFKVIAYIQKSRVTMMKVEVIKESDAIVDLLLAEYEVLQSAKDDVNCLNTRFFNNEYFPNWIPQTAVNEFQKRLQGAKPTDTDKNLKRFLSRNIDDNDLVDTIFAYVKKNFKPGNRYNVR